MSAATRGVAAGSEARLRRVDPSDVAVVILGGGQGTRLFPLTRMRAKPAVSFGGKYRLIDIPLTNCLRSGFEKIFILTQFNSFSLNRHVWQTYGPVVRGQGFVDVLAAEQTIDNPDWFQGTADAVRQSLMHVLYRRPSQVLILSGDQIYSMDYREMLLWHYEHGSDVTIAAKYLSEEQIRSFGIVKINRELAVTDFFEKPKSPELVTDCRLDRTNALAYPEGQPYLCSMGLYLFDTQVLVEALDNREKDFGKTVIPTVAKRRRMGCFPFSGYWEDVGTIESFYRANMEWRSGGGISIMFEEGNSIITRSRQLPPSRIDGTRIEDSLIADGCRIQAARISRSVIGLRARIGPGTVVEDSIIMGNDEILDPDEFQIGANCVIRRAIIDKNTKVGDGSVIVNEGNLEDVDEETFSVRSGIVVLPREVVIPAGTRI